MRKGDRHAWETLVQELAQPQLVGRVDVGEEEADGDGGVALGVVRHPLRDAAGEILQRLVGERDERPAVEIEPLRDPKAVAPLDQRPRLGPLQREVVLAVHALDVWDVLETGGGDVDDRGPISLQERVRRHGGADADAIEGVGRGLALGDGIHDGVDGTGGGRWGLGDDQLPRLVVDPDQIGKGPARVDPESNSHLRSLPRFPPNWCGSRATMLSDDARIGNNKDVVGACAMWAG